MHGLTDLKSIQPWSDKCSDYQTLTCYFFHLSCAHMDSPCAAALPQCKLMLHRLLSNVANYTWYLTLWWSVLFSNSFKQSRESCMGRLVYWYLFLSHSSTCFVSWGHCWYCSGNHRRASVDCGLFPTCLLLWNTCSRYVDMFTKCVWYMYGKTVQLEKL